MLCRFGEHPEVAGDIGQRHLIGEVLRLVLSCPAEHLDRAVGLIHLDVERRQLVEHRRRRRVDLETVVEEVVRCIILPVLLEFQSLVEVVIKFPLLSGRKLLVGSGRQGCGDADKKSDISEKSEHI